MLKEFRDFAMRGNLIDMAVGIIMGVAFGGLVNSMVNDLIMPIVGAVTGGVDFSKWFINLSGPQDQYATLKAAKDAGAATINLGLFINLVINFVIVAFVMFLLIKGMNKAMRKAPPDPVPAAAPTKSEVLLEEIRRSPEEGLIPGRETMPGDPGIRIGRGNCRETRLRGIFSTFARPQHKNFLVTST